MNDFMTRFGSLTLDAQGRIRAARRAGAEAGISLRKRRAWFDGVPMTRAQWESLTNIETALRTVWLDQIQPDTTLMGLYDVETSQRAQEKNLGYGGLGDVPEYTGTLKFDGFEELFPATYLHKEYAKGIALERKLVDDEEYGVMRQRAQLSGLAFDRTVQKHAAVIFNTAFDTSAITGPDGKALCATDHPHSPSDVTPQSNRGVEPLSHDSVRTTKELMRRFQDSEGNPLNVMPDTLVVPIELEDAARVIVESTQRSGVANNDINTQRGYNIVTSPFLMTDANNWFLIDSRLARLWLHWYWRIRPEFTTDPTSDFNLVLRFRGYMRYVYGFDHWAWIYGHVVS
ncbi:MAG TPA: Mu-like prophage major head subunit gpT family protein [Phototrophicaceae bacterium]|nr:Mu-like prophage major head subunit gpT family protein [Phototrophicaceae bacterium]